MTTVALAPHFEGEGRITFREHAYPEPGPGQLLLRVEANAICGTDRKQYLHGSRVVPGHEAAGTVAQAGEGTTTRLGTRGVVFLMAYCGTCRSCRLGFTNQCLEKRGDTGFTQDGGYGPYLLVQESSFFHVGDDVSAVDATLLLDVMGTSGHAIRRAQLVRPDTESVYIAGAGPIGLGLLLSARLRFGPQVPVYVSDVSEWRRAYAAELGATPVDPYREPLPRVDIAFDSTGRTVARRAALSSVEKRGALVCVGHGESLVLEVSPDLIGPERAVLGSEYFCYDELPGNLDLLRRHGTELRKIITHTLPVQDIGQAFQLFLGGTTGKVVVTQGPT